MGSGAHACRARAGAAGGGRASRAAGPDRRRAVTDDGARLEGAVAGGEGRWPTLDEGNPLPAAAAAGALADLFRRAGRGGADLHDPSAELLRWLTRDLARAPDVTDEAYDAAILTLPRYLRLLRAHRPWPPRQHA